MGFYHLWSVCAPESWKLRLGKGWGSESLSEICPGSRIHDNPSYGGPSSPASCQLVQEGSNFVLLVFASSGHRRFWPAVFYAIFLKPGGAPKES